MPAPGGTIRRCGRGGSCMTRTGISSVRSVIESKDEVGKVVQLTYPRRFNAGLRAMRREILSGRWGKVTMVVAYDCEDWITPNAGTWRHDPEMWPGGFLYDANRHQLRTICDRIKGRGWEGCPVDLSAPVQRRSPGDAAGDSVGSVGQGDNGRRVRLRGLDHAECRHLAARSGDVPGGILV